MITAWIGSILLLGVAILYCCIAAGYPLGEFAMGGKNRLPDKKMRISCGVSVLLQIFLLLVLLQLGGIFSIGLPLNAAKIIGYVTGGYFCLNTLMNLFSRSNKERFVMTPLSAITAFCFLFTAINV